MPLPIFLLSALLLLGFLLLYHIVITKKMAQLKRYNELLVGKIELQEKYTQLKREQKKELLQREREIKALERHSLSEENLKLQKQYRSKLQTLYRKEAEYSMRAQEQLNECQILLQNIEDELQQYDN